jgi:hypothetical protein
VGVTRKARLGAVCVVWIHRGVERIVPVEATDLADEFLETPSPCRLSVASVKGLLAVVASFSEPLLEEAHAAEIRATPEPAHFAAQDSSTSGPTVGNGGSPHGPLRSGGGVGEAGTCGAGSAAQGVDACPEGGDG